MGLDMYLTAEKYISAYDFASDDAKETYRKISEAVGADEFRDKDTPTMHVKMTVGYWRKANQIHSWFVRNVQDGVDECQESYVSIEQLDELRETCLAVLADTSKAGELLPPQSGFFFGSTDIDDWYLGDLHHTVKMIDRIKEHLPEDWSINYQSSW